MQALGPIKARLNIVRADDKPKEDPHLHPARVHSPKHLPSLAGPRPASPQKRTAPLTAKSIDLETHDVRRQRPVQGSRCVDVAADADAAPLQAQGCWPRRKCCKQKPS